MDVSHKLKGGYPLTSKSIKAGYPGCVTEIFTVSHPEVQLI